VDKVHSYGLKAKPGLGIQFEASGDTATEALESTGTSDPSEVVRLDERFVDAGVKRIMIESEGITENVKSWRTDVIQTIMKELPREKVMFEGKCPSDVDDLDHYYAGYRGPLLTSLVS
jgi:phosphosulfolactate synthase (CoM biosynthesis protein A)